MPFSRAGQLARFVPTARPTDPLGLVAENMREAPHGVLPVLDRASFDEDSQKSARIIGLITQDDLAKATRAILERDALATELSAADVMRRDVPYISPLFSLHNALLCFDRYDAPALPVVDEAGRYHGLISRADVFAALGNHVRPSVVGGMATPLGVWLTDGRLTGGASNLGLFLSGVTLAFCLMASQWLLAALTYPINKDWAALAFSGRLGLFNAEGIGMLNGIFTLVHGVLFLLLLRALPMSGVHAAEHQVVHAIERGLPLTPEYVAKMPRAHPRCGTNLMAISALILIAFQHVPDTSHFYLLLTLVFAFFFWRSTGTFLQEFFTTRPASPKQIQGGIRAARELLEKYQAQPFATSPTPLRLLNNGLLFSALGMMLTLFLLQSGADMFARMVLSSN